VALHLFLSETECRDKMFKVLQYGARLTGLVIRQYFPAWTNWQDIVKRMVHLDNSTSMCRKYLRTFAYLPLWRLALKVYHSDDGGWLKLCVLGRLLGLSGYFFFDNVVWAIKTRILDGWGAMKFTRIGLSFQLVNQISSFIVNLHNLRGVRDESLTLRFQLEVNKELNRREREGRGPLVNGGRRRTHSFTGAEEQVLRHQLRTLKTKKLHLYRQMVKNVLEGCLAANVVFELRFHKIIATCLDLINAYLSTNEVFLKLKAKAKNEKQGKKTQIHQLETVQKVVHKGEEIMRENPRLQEKKQLRQRASTFF
jgi:hypothetical protein